MEIYILIALIIVVIAVILILTVFKSPKATYEKEHLALFRETANALADRIMHAPDSPHLYQFILESTLRLIPKARCGNILMFNSEGLLVARASMGFGKGINDLKLKLEDSFIYHASGGRLEGPVIMNRLGDVVSRDDDEEPNNAAIKSEIAVPLFNNREPVGLLCVDGDKIDIFTERDSQVLDFMSRQISIVINYQKLNNDVIKLAKYDHQTQLMNRTNFEDEVLKIFNDPSKDIGNLHFVLMNLDNLRVANDLFGHHFGDKIIENFAEIIKRHLGKNDLCGRYGGDEFVAVIQGDFIHVNFVMEATRKEFMAAKSSFLDKDYTPSFSYGYNSFREGLGDLDTFYKLSEYRMREMKGKKESAEDVRDREKRSRRDRVLDMGHGDEGSDKRA